MSIPIQPNVYESAMSESPILKELERKIAFQRKWRRITSLSYFTGASLSVIATVAATVVAGRGDAQSAAFVAAAAAIFTSLEKVLLFREKWSHHRAVELELEFIRLSLLAHQIDENKAIEQMKQVITFYTRRMPSVEDNKPSQ